MLTSVQPQKGEAAKEPRRLIGELRCQHKRPDRAAVLWLEA